MRSEAFMWSCLLQPMRGAERSEPAERGGGSGRASELRGAKSPRGPNFTSRTVASG